MTPLGISIAAALASLALLAVVFELIRRHRLRERYALLWLLTCFDKTSGNTPTISRTKPVLEQEHAPFPVHDYGRGGDCEARVSCAHGQAA